MSELKPLKELPAAEFSEAYKNGHDYQIIDVRTDEEVFFGAIPGTKHIPLDQFEERFKEIDPNKPCLLVCRSGARSNRAGHYLLHMGYHDVTNLVGGILEWTGEKERINE
jgi:rhodanese-related sulfurtransferase